MYKNETKHQRAIAECGEGAAEADVKAKYIELGGLYVEETEVAEEMTTDDVSATSTDHAEEPRGIRGRGRKSS